MFLICGLGNPGKEYIDTRHNIGFALIDKLVSFYNFISYKKDSKKEIFKGVINNNSCFLLKPLNFMNLSGQPIREVMNFYKIAATARASFYFYNNEKDIHQLVDGINYVKKIFD